MPGLTFGEIAVISVVCLVFAAAFAAVAILLWRAQK